MEKTWLNKAEELHEKVHWNEISRTKDDICKIENLSLSFLEPVMMSHKLNTNNYLCDILYNVNGMLERMQTAFTIGEVEYEHKVGFFGIRKMGCDGVDFIYSQLSNQQYALENYYDDVYMVTMTVHEDDWSLARDYHHVEIKLYRASVVKGGGILK